MQQEISTQFTEKWLVEKDLRILFLSREEKFQEKPALVVELKWNQSAEGAIAQIGKKEYCASLEEYKGNILLVGVNYDKKTKEHNCVIEEYSK